MDSSPGTSHHKYDSSRKRDNNGYSNGESRHHRRKHHKSPRSRSKSRSSSAELRPKRAYINPSFYWDKAQHAGGGSSYTFSEYEVKIQALSTQLTMAQSQITGLDAQIHSHRTRSSQLEHQLYNAQQENLNLMNRNSEILAVMKTLEAGVETLQNEKDTLKLENDELKARTSGFEKEKSGLSDQIVYLEKRNATLSKKCVEILESGKANKEKLEKTEAELNNLKPHAEAAESRLKELEDQHRSALSRITTFETREKLWVNEKLAIEQRVKDLLAAEKRTQEELRQLRLKEIAAATAAAALQSSVNNNAIDLDVSGVEAEHLKALSFVVDSLQAHHQTELNRLRLKLEVLDANNRTSH